MEFTERELAAMDYIRPLTETVSHTGDTLYDHLFNTFIILKTMGCTEEVCLAGLYHSVYGTQYFKYETLADDTSIAQYVGEYGENLVRLFCADNRDYMLMAEGNPLKIAPPVLMDLLFIHYANTYEQNSEDRALTDIEEQISAVGEMIKEWSQDGEATFGS